MSLAVWDSGKWDHDVWQGTKPRPGAGWGEDWAVWYQVGAKVVTELTGMCVEIRWTTDSHTMGDGTFRGDIQPGKCQIRFWDPGHTLEGLDKMGAVWATYVPTGATWCWFYDSLTRGLVAPGDPSGADVVFTGLVWPARLTANILPGPGYSVEPVSTRIASIVANINGTGPLGSNNYQLPAFAANAAPQSQVVPPPASTTVSTFPAPVFPAFLDVIRQAAATGVAWLSVARNPATEVGSLTLNYARWDTHTLRMLQAGQVLAGPPVTQSGDWLITSGSFTATKGDTGVVTTCYVTSTPVLQYGLQGPSPLRLWGNVTNPTGPEYSAAIGTLQALVTSRGSASYQYLSSLNLQSGHRNGPAGGPLDYDWDPYAHSWQPTEQLGYKDPVTFGTIVYRVCSASHILNAAAWQTTLTVETNIDPVALPA